MDKKGPSKSPNKRHSLKQNVEGASERSKGNFNERIPSSEETSSEESMNAEFRIHRAQIHSRKTCGENIRKESFEKSERDKMKQTSQSHIERNFQSISKPIESKKEKVCKRPLSSEQTSSDELVKAGESQTRISQLNSHTKDGKKSQKVPRKHDGEKKRIILKLQKKQNSWRKDVVDTSSSKVKDKKKLFPRKEHSKERYQIQKAQTYSRSISGETCWKVTFEKSEMERKKSTSKSLVKTQSSKKSAERILKPIESSKGKVSKKSLSTAQTSEDLNNANKSQSQSSQLYSHATVKGKIRKEEHKKLEVEILRLTLKFKEKQNSLKKNEETTNSKMEAEKNISSEDTSSDESKNAEESQIKNIPIYSRVTVRGKSRKDVTSKLEVKEIKLTIKLQETQNSSRKNVLETSNSKVKAEKFISSKEKSSNKLSTADESQIKSPQIYSNVHVGNKKQKEVSKEVKKSLTSKSHEKQHLSKKSVDETSSHKAKVGEKIFFTEKTSSDELVDVEFPIQRTQTYSRPNTNENGRNKAFENSKIKIKSSSKSPIKKHSWKKKFQRFPKTIKSSKKKVCKRPLSSEKTSSEEWLNADESKVQNFRKCSHANDGTKSEMKATRETEVESKRTTLKLPEKPHSSKKSIDNSIQNKSKREGNKGIISCKQGFLGEFVKDNSFHIGHDHMYSRIFLEKNSREKASKILKRNGPPKRNISKTTADKPLQRTRSSQRDTQRINYCEDDSPDEQVNDDMTQNNSNFETLKNDDCHEASSSRAMFSNNKIERRDGTLFESKSNSLEDLHIDVVGSDTADISDTNKFLNRDASPSTLTQHHNKSKSKTFSPFIFWGKNIEKISHSKYGEQKDGLEVDDTCSKKDSKQMNKVQLSKEWEKYKALMMKSNKEQCWSKTDNAASGSSSQYHRSDDLEYINELRNSEGNVRTTEVSRDIKNDTYSQNAEKVVRNDVKKHHENSDVPYEGENKETSSSKIESETSSFHNERQDFKSIQPIIDSECSVERIYGTGDEACVQNFLGLVSCDNVRKASEILKSPNKNLDDIETSMSKILYAEPGCSLHDEKKSLIPTRNSKNSITPKNDSAEIEDSICGSITPKLLKENKKCSFLRNLEDMNDLCSSKPEAADKESTTCEGSNENIDDLKYSPLTSENKGVLKRRSDPSNALKENRQRESF